jgi:hypothetical protein
MKTDKTKIPNLEAVILGLRDKARQREYGIQFGGGTCMLLLAETRSSQQVGDFSGMIVLRKVTSDCRLVVDTLTVPAVR